MPRGVAADAQLRLLGHLGLGDQGAGRRIPPGELDAGLLADEAASSVAPDEVLPPATAGRRIARRRGRCRPARNRSPRVRDRAAPPALRPSRRGCARCGSATARARRDAGSGKSLMSNAALAEALDLRDLPLRRGTDRRYRADREPRWCASEDRLAREPGRSWSGAPLDDRDVDLRQRQLARQHHPRRTSSGDHHSMLGDTHFAPPISVGSDLRRRLCGTIRGFMRAFGAV